MLRTRIIPTLLLRNESLIKTVRFGKFSYVGDPANTVRIFNELEVDELLFLDVTATVEGRKPNLKVLAEIADECFMPLGYGGGIRSFEDAQIILKLGFEKVVVNTRALEEPSFITRLSEHFGSQAIIVSIDVKRGLFWGDQVRSRAGGKNARRSPVEWAREVERLGAGEILLTSIDREGTWEGFDLDLVRSVSEAVRIPVIANGGAGKVEHIGQAVKEGCASAVALGSMVVFQRKGMGVLVNFPEESELRRILA
ncbi:MAG: imidazole glycerol phosphate synthase subunit HisF [Verrucomicrobia bacterium]|nr:imidazole glycerol phosphate synthase subunit HisF [Verrucomicrobiota bacterium]